MQKISASCDSVHHCTFLCRRPRTVWHGNRRNFHAIFSHSPIPCTEKMCVLDGRTVRYSRRSDSEAELIDDESDLRCNIDDLPSALAAAAAAAVRLATVSTSNFETTASSTAPCRNSIAREPYLFLAPSPKNQSAADGFMRQRQLLRNRWFQHRDEREWDTVVGHVVQWRRWDGQELPRDCAVNWRHSDKGLL